MPWQFEPKKDVCMSTISTISPPTDIINRWSLNGATYPDVSRDYPPQGEIGNLVN